MMANFKLKCQSQTLVIPVDICPTEKFDILLRLEEIEAGVG